MILNDTQSSIRTGSLEPHEFTKKKLGMRGYSLDVHGLALFHQKLSYFFPSTGST